MTFDEINVFPPNLENALKKIKKECFPLRYIKIYNKLLYINEVLLHEGFCLKFYCLRDKIKQVIFKDIENFHVKTKQDKRLVTLVDNVFNSLSEIEDIHVDTNKLKFINLVAELTSSSTFTVSYCNDIGSVFRIIYGKKGRNLQAGTGHMCYPCSHIFLNKKNLDKHKEVCTGIHGGSLR